jgi:hypothetical protein
MGCFKVSLNGKQVFSDASYDEIKSLIIQNTEPKDNYSIDINIKELGISDAEEFKDVLVDWIQTNVWPVGHELEFPKDKDKKIIELFKLIKGE